MTGKAESSAAGGHSANYLKMAMDSGRREILSNPDAHGKNTGECGDTVEFFLRTENDRVAKACFVTNGCINTHICANTAAAMVEGRTISEAWEVTHEKIIDFLETLPEESFHCAELAVGALYRALRNYQELKRNFWKKMYRKF